MSYPDRSDTPFCLDPELMALLQRAEQGDREVVPALRQALDENPQIWHEAGDLARNAELCLVELAAGPNQLLREALLRKLQSLRAELSEPGDPSLVRLLISRAVLDWLELHHLDALVAQLRQRFSTPPQVEALERRRNHSHRRYLNALKSLASVRKLLTRAPAPLEVAARLGIEPRPRSACRRSGPSLVRAEAN